MYFLSQIANCRFEFRVSSFEFVKPGTSNSERETLVNSAGTSNLLDQARDAVDVAGDRPGVFSHTRLLRHRTEHRYGHMLLKNGGVGLLRRVFSLSSIEQNTHDRHLFLFEAIQRHESVV